MKNLKRVLSMGLASVMLLGMMVVGASAANTTDFTDADKIQNVEAVTTMAALNVIKGKDTGDFDPTGTVTRAEMAKMITIIMNGGEEPVLAINAANPMFTDIGGHWAQKYIEYCATNGIISGRGDGKFDPNANVTGTEAAKMALVALNYNSKVFKFEGDKDWMLNINSIANNPNNKLFTGLSSVNPANALTRDQAAQLLYNALDAKMMRVSYDIVNSGANAGTIGTNYSVSDVTLMEEKFNTIKAEGVITGNEIVSLGKNAEGKQNEAQEEGKTELTLSDDLKDKDDVKLEDKDNPIYLNITTDLKVLGRSVTAYVRQNKKTGDFDVVGGVVISSNNVEASDFTGKAADKIASKKVTTQSTKDKTNEATEYYLNFALKTNEAGLGITRGDTVTILSNDGNKKAEYVFAMEYTLDKVVSISEKNETIRFQSAGTTKYENIIGEYEGLEKNDYVLTTKVNGKVIIEEPTTVEGTLKAYKNDDDKNVIGLTVDTTKYDTSWADVADKELKIANTKKPSIGTDATFYVDANGLIVAYGNVATKAKNYAISWGGASGNVIDTGRVKMTLADGTTKIYTISADSNWKLATEDGDIDGKVYAYAGNSANLKDAKRNAVGTLVTYTFDDDGDIKINIPETNDVIVDSNAAGWTGSTTTAPVANEEDGITFTQGKTLVTVGTVSGTELTDRTSYSTSSTTPFFFVSMDEKQDLVTKVEVLTGYKDTKSVAGVAYGAQVATNNTSAEAVSYLGYKDPTGVKVDVSQHLYVVSVDFTYDKYVDATVHMAGSDKEVQVELARNPEIEADSGVEIPEDAENDDMNKVYKGNIWLYTLNSKDQYELLSPAKENAAAAKKDKFWFTGKVGKTSNISVELGDNQGDADEYFITDESVIISPDDEGKYSAVLGGGVEAFADIQILVDTKTDTVLMAKCGAAPTQVGTVAENVALVNGAKTVDMTNVATLTTEIVCDENGKELFNVANELKGKQSKKAAILNLEFADMAAGDKVTINGGAEQTLDADATYYLIVGDKTTSVTVKYQHGAEAAVTCTLTLDWGD